MKVKAYNDKFFENNLRSLESAGQIVPVVKEFVSPESVIDIGCGIGAFLSVFIENGVSDALGVDGPWVDISKLQIPRGLFIASDLVEPLPINRGFDLVISLEVAEHLPEKSARAFIKTLTGLGRVVLFSAAVPGQGGRNHFNEKWPSYWAEMFASFGYVAVDCLRKRLWNNNKVEYWYAQNMMFYVKENVLGEFKRLEEEFGICKGAPLSLVHPALYLKKASGKKLFGRTSPP